VALRGGVSSSRDVGVLLKRWITAAPGDLARIAQAAEQLGYHSIWLPEHVVVPVEVRSRYPYTTDGHWPRTYDTVYAAAMVTLGFLAAVTSRVRLGTAVVPMTTRDPLTMAKQAATVDCLSNGRLELGLGAGWMVEEAVVLGQPMDHRGARLDEAIDIMRKAWSEPSFSHSGRFWQIPPVGVHPHPPQGAGLPIWIGGTSPAALRTTCDRAIGNILHHPTPEEVSALRGQLPARTRIAATIPLDFSARDPVKDAHDLRGAGADLITITPNENTSAETLVADLERFARALSL
jgi:probable F420-dependent oxidoreductase